MLEPDMVIVICAVWFCVGLIFKDVLNEFIGG